jgi:nucleoside-diphosphate-sugar epimerase
MVGSGNSGTALVTGASGFIGQRLLAHLERLRIPVRVLVRDPGRFRSHLPRESIYSGDLTVPESLPGVCAGIDTVYHLASYAHAQSEDESGDTLKHERITVEGTRRLLEDAARHRVRRVLYVSSVKAMGEGGPVCLDENTEEHPAGAYGRAKLAAEKMVHAAGAQAGVHACVLRLPLVYGPGSKGNLVRLIAAIERGWFPPVPKIENRRSMIHVEDVVRALLQAADSPQARGRTYIVTDGEVYSTRMIYEWIRIALGRTVPSWSVPVSLLRLMARTGDAVGWLCHKPFPINSDALEKLLGSACYSSKKISHELDFTPAYTLKAAIPEMVASYRVDRSRNRAVPGARPSPRSHRRGK